ncbi:MAG: GTPase HflX [Candidatus Omnitrophica bacterium]|jgi:GTP-binding protein HflX|nr:GTPase HflX [Candidatus Omnitrophota bacterium]
MDLLSFLPNNFNGKTGLILIFKHSNHLLTEENKKEIESLCKTLGIAGKSLLLNSPVKINPAIYIGKGKVEEIKNYLNTEKTDFIIFENDLSPIQQRNLEDFWQIKILDRTEIILSIFARHAHTLEGKLQIELANLTYILPRLAGSGVGLSRLGGTIGTRGPGEQKIEIQRRRVRERIKWLNDKIKEIEKHRMILRESRERKNLPVIAVVGYTNVGKSALINKLIHRRDAYTDNKLFSTLDPLTRLVYLSEKHYVLVSDTVGLLANLPHHLISAFKSTLEELRFADLLLIVIDSTNQFIDKQKETVYKVIDMLGIENKPRIEVFNKIDLLAPEDLIILQRRYQENLFISADSGEGINLLKEFIYKEIYGKNEEGKDTSDIKKNEETYYRNYRCN